MPSTVFMVRCCLNIPTVTVYCCEVLRLQPGAWSLVDGDIGWVLLRTLLLNCSCAHAWWPITDAATAWSTSDTSLSTQVVYDGHGFSA